MNTLEVLQDLLIGQYRLDREQLAPEVELAAIGVDSLGLIELMFQVEEKFGISLPDDRFPVLVTIRDVVDYVDQLTARGSAAPADPPAANLPGT